MSEAILPLNDFPAEDLSRLYAEVFAGPEWFELEKCSHCGRAYPGPEGTRKGSFSQGEACWNDECGKPLELLSFYMDPEDRLAERIIADARSRPGFVGLVAVGESRELRGFSWGYGLPATDSPSVRFSEVSSRIAEAGIRPEDCFYAAETGILPDAQRAGLGRALVRARLKAAASSGFDTALFRTIDRERLVGLYRSIFGEVRELFKDPDPAKSQIWYSVQIEAMT